MFARTIGSVLRGNYNDIIKKIKHQHVAMLKHKNETIKTLC